jgi:hypothetical protein
MPRRSRPSLSLFHQIHSTRQITLGQRRQAFELVRKNRGEWRPFCRSKDGKSTPTEPTYRRIVRHHWLLDYHKDLMPIEGWWEYISFPWW